MVRRIEWPTVVVAAVIHVAWLSAVFGHRVLPWWASVALLGVIGAWFGSLQHEVIHRHPTPWSRVNRLTVPLPLTVWVNFDRYRISHLTHHASDLTTPGADPESFYLTSECWERANPVMRRLCWINRTLVGRLIIGPWWSMIGYGRGEFASCRRSDATRRQWAVHLVGLTVTMVIVHASRMPLWEYLVGMGYVAMSLTMLRSFAEHRAIDGPNRSAAIRSGGFFGILFLHNNLHNTHHAAPAAPWYELPRLHARMGSDEIAAAGAGWYRSYGELMWRFALRPFCQPEHPLVAVGEG